MAAEIRQFRRRHVMERQVLQIVRGKCFRGMLKNRPARQRSTESADADEEDALCFWCLRELARQCGLEIMAEGCHYVSLSELWLLRWLAEAQRHTGLRSLHIDDPGFRAALEKSADVLKSAGLFLPSRALNIAVNLRDVPLSAPLVLQTGKSLSVSIRADYPADHGS